MKAVTKKQMTSQQFRALAKETAQIADWMTVRDFASQIWGDKATRVVITSYGEYNDEGGTDYRIDDVIAHDKDGKVLSPDYSLPFFQSKFWKGDEDDENHISIEPLYADMENRFIMQLKELWMTDAERRRESWLLLNDLPCPNDECETVFDLTTAPTVPLFLSLVPSFSQLGPVLGIE